MKIDVLICVHSQDHFHDVLLQRALESLVRQTYSVFSVIIVLDECHEDTSEIVRKYREVLDIRFFERPKRSGLANAKNFGISKSDADWIAYLDADDIYYSEYKLERQVEFALAHPEYSVIACQAVDIYNPGTDQEIIQDNCFFLGQYESHDKIATRIMNENIICHGSCFIKREALEAVGGYPTDKKFLGMEDWALHIKLINAGYKYYNLPSRDYGYSMNTSVPR